MKRLIQAICIVVGTAMVCNAADPLPGTEEFGLTKKQLAQYIERVETLISKRMREQGFQYIAVDYNTVRRGMTAGKNLPGMDEEEFIQTYGYGISTLYTGKPPQLTDGYCPARIGLGEENIRIFRSLSPADQAAYNRALFGEDSYLSFAVALEIEDFSRTGGCTRKAIEQVFKQEQLKASYYNPKYLMMQRDPRMKAAIRKCVGKLRKAGFDYGLLDEMEPDIRRRLDLITKGGTVPLEAMSPEQKEALRKLREYERRVALLEFKLDEKYIAPVEEKIEEERYSRDAH